MLLTTDLLIAVAPIAKRRGLVAVNSDPGVFGTERNFRIPDLVIARPDQISKRGFEGAELVIEVLSPRDESRDKFSFYASVGVREIWLIEPSDRVTEAYELVGAGYRAIPFVDGMARSPVLGIELRVADDKLELHDGDERAVI